MSVRDDVMSRESQDVMRKLVEHAGPYPEDAFYFVRDGLSHGLHSINKDRSGRPKSNPVW